MYFHLFVQISTDLDNGAFRNIFINRLKFDVLVIEFYYSISCNF